MTTDPLAAALVDDIPIVVLSPHLDDAVLSCGALINYARQRTSVTVATLFTEGAPGPYTLSARRHLWRMGIRDAEQLYDRRRSEDRALLESLGLKWFHAGLTEALYRKKPGAPVSDHCWRRRIIPELTHVYPTYRLHITSGRIAAQDIETLHRVCHVVEMLSREPGPRVLLAPLGIGGHVDHVLVRTAARLSGEVVVYYSEFPYNRRYPTDSEFVQRRALIATTWTRGLVLKPDLIRAYETQACDLFPSGWIAAVPDVYVLPDASRQAVRHRVADAESPNGHHVTSHS
ncbi:MAG: PIG-L deacetylase family protein [Solirubrobacteraceae bacterium]